jgi:hypothetical protein
LGCYLNFTIFLPPRRYLAIHWFLKQLSHCAVIKNREKPPSMTTSHVSAGKLFYNNTIVLPAIMLGLVLLTPAVALANGPYSLDSIDLMSSQQQATNNWSSQVSNTANIASHNGDLTNNRIDVMLYTGGIVPYKVTYADGQKTVLEFDNVRAAETVKTNFVGNATGQLSHVIVQPLNDHQLRLVLRGQQLGIVSVGFKDPSTTQVNGNSGGSTPQDGSQIQSSFGEGFAGTPTIETSPTPSPLSTLSLDEATNATGVKSTNPFEVDPLVSRQTSTHRIKTVVSDDHFNPFIRQSNSRLKHTKQAALNDTKWSAYIDNFWRNLAHLPQWDLAFLGSIMPFAMPVACLIALATCLGLFLRHKWLQLNQQERMSRQLADGLPQQTLNDGSRDSLLLDPIIDQPAPKKNSSMQSPIGLGGLLPNANQEQALSISNPITEERFYNPQEAELDWIAEQRAKLGLKPKMPSATNVPSQQVAQRYAQYSQTPAPVDKSMVKPPISRAIIQEEIRRSSEIQRQSTPISMGSGRATNSGRVGTFSEKQVSNTNPANPDNATGRIFGRKPGAKKGATGVKSTADPLPNNNPEVLAFLNAMADKLDKRSNSNPVK